MRDTDGGDATICAGIKSRRRTQDDVLQSHANGRGKGVIGDIAPKKVEPAKRCGEGRVQAGILLAFEEKSRTPCTTLEKIVGEVCVEVTDGDATRAGGGKIEMLRTTHP